MGMTGADEVRRTQLGVTSLSQFVRMRNCERFLRFRLNRADARRLP